MSGKKSFPILLILGLIISGFGIAEQKADLDIRESVVYDSLDGDATIYVGEMSPVWNCTNITVYKNITELAVDNNTTDTGGGHTGYDTFKFDFDLQLPGLTDGDEIIAVGETNAEGKNYTFITNHTITERGGNCFNTTEWEPIPEPAANSKGASWINISIPKFKNPQKNKYNNATPNINNTIGFAIYRGDKNNSWNLNKNYLKIGNAMHSDGDYYYFNDTALSPRTTYYYAVAPMAKGGYITYGKSLGVGISTTPLVTVDSPNGGEDWSGNSSHLINYTIQNGEAPYVVNLSYSVDGINWTRFNTTTCNKLGTYIYNWITPTIDSNTVKIRISVTDNKLVADFDTSNDTFEIDSTPPGIENTLPGNGSSCSLSSSIAIEFCEPMNKTSSEDAFSYTDGNNIWSCSDGTINWIGNIMVFTPYEDFEIGTKYNCTISTFAKDDSEPGNNLLKDYRWSFTAAPGMGNFSVNVDYPPSTITVGIYQIKVVITNEVNAENRSGGLIVKFLKSSNGEDFFLDHTETVSEMFPGDSTTVYMNLSLSEGIWYFKVNITSTNPDDVINGYKQYYETTPYIIEVVPLGQIPEKEGEIAPEPYVLIAIMVIAVIFIAVIVLLCLKKKGVLVIKEKIKKEK